MTAVRHQIRFLLNGRAVALEAVGPNDTLLDWLRLDRRLTGTKEGCAEGDCGACTVLVGRRDGDGLRYDTVNACICLLASVDLCHVVTVEHVRGADGGLHPVQAAMVAHHGSQCGFCTPGVVMSLYALWMAVPSPTVGQVEEALQGNLCRCTGYRPIVDAALAAAKAARDGDPLIAERTEVAARLTAMDDGARVEVTAGGGRAILPATKDDLLAVLDREAGATIVAGATDVGLWVTKDMRDLSPAVLIGHLPALKEISSGPEGLSLGAGVTYSDAAAAITAHVPQIADYWARIGGWQVRNMGTVGGNIANGSPIGDTPPPLIALGATVVLESVRGRRDMPLEEFFIAYGKQDRAAGEVVTEVRVPPVADNAMVAFYKLSKRRDEDITAVAAAFCITVEDNEVSAARIALGGMAATPKRARAVETALIGRPWTEATVRAAMPAFADDFQPLSDWRASADYRGRAAANLLERFWRETQGQVASLRRAS